MTTNHPMPWFEEAWIPGGPDWTALWRLADQQGGFFTNAEARTCGVRRSLLSDYARRNVFERVHRGVYRLPPLESSPFDTIRAVWMAAGRTRAVVSHDSALYLLGLLDDEPPQVHLTLPRERRGRVPRREDAGKRRLRFHVPRVWPAEEEITVREGIRVTAAPRAILDVATSRAGSGGLGEAIRRAVDRGEAAPGWLVAKAREHGGRARWRVEGALLNSHAVTA